MNFTQQKLLINKRNELYFCKNEKKKVCTTYYKFQIEQNMKNKKAKI